MKKLNLLSAVIIIVMFTNCSIEKRHYMNGYNVQWNYKSKIKNSISVPADVNENLIASTKKEIIPTTEKQVPLVNINAETAVVNDTCDVIVTTRKTIRARVLSINNLTIKFIDLDKGDTIKRNIMKDGVQEIKFSNGENLTMYELRNLLIQNKNRKELLEMVKETVIADAPENELIKNKCFDRIRVAGKTINAIVTKIDDGYVEFTVYRDDGTCRNGINRISEIPSITFCGGARAKGADFENLKISVTNRKDMCDSLFWKKYKSDAWFRHFKKVNVKLLEIGKDSIKYMDFSYPNNKEITISSKKVKKIVLNNGEYLTRTEIRTMKNKIVANDAIYHYSKSLEHKEELVREFTNKSLLNASFFLVPLSIPFDIRSIVYAKKAKKIIKNNPPLYKYKAKANSAIALAIAGLIIGGIWMLIIAVLLLANAWAGGYYPGD